MKASTIKKISLPWENEKEFYDIHSREIFHNHDFYESAIIGQTDSDFLLFMLGELNINQSSILVDLGCGSGYLAQAASRICRKAIGISTSTECIKVCKERRQESERLQFIEANMEDYVYPNATHVVAMESMGYADMDKTFQSVNKSLIKSGTFYIRELARLLHENPKRRENREYIEEYFGYKTRISADIISCAKSNGFEIMSLQDHTAHQNDKNFLNSIKYYKAPFNVPHLDEDIYIKKVHMRFQKVQDIN